LKTAHGKNDRDINEQVLNLEKLLKEKTGQTSRKNSSNKKEFQETGSV
jgi:hypothetical protein